MLKCNVHLPASWGGTYTQKDANVSSSNAGLKKRKIEATSTSRKCKTKVSKRECSSAEEDNNDDENNDEDDRRNEVKRKRLSGKTISTYAFKLAADNIEGDSGSSSSGAVRSKDDAKQEGGPPQSARDACENILASIQRCQNISSKQTLPLCKKDLISINLDHILSRVPYKEMLKDLFGSNASLQSGYRAPQIPVVTKAYEESFMRQPIFDYERPCVMGAQCECNFVSSNASDAFTAVEFLLPSEQQKYDKQFDDDSDGSDGRKRQMCVLCHRKLVQKLFYDMIYSGSPYR